MIEIYLCYAPEDDRLRQALEKQLQALQRQKLLIALWSSHNISAGEERRLEIEKHLDAAHIILLLLSPDFLAADDFYHREVMQAIQRYERGEARVVPILLRPVHWHDTPLGNLQALPENGKPVTDRSWHTLDEALFNVADGIRKVVEELSVPEDLASEFSTKLITSSVHRAKPEEPRLAPERDEANFAVVQTLVNHLGPVACVLFTPDGETLVSDSWDNTIKYWDSHFRVRQTLTEHSGPIYSIAQNLNVRTELSSGGDDGLIRLWHFETGTLMASLGGHSGPISSVAFSPDGSILASGSDDCTLRIWDLVTRVPIATSAGHSGPISSVAFSPDGSILASGSYDMTVRFWNTRGTALFALTGHAGPISSIIFHPNGILAASGSHDSTIKLWDLRTRQVQKTLEGHSGPVSSLAFSPDGRTLISGSYDKTIKVWDYFTGQALATCAEHSAAVLCVAFHPWGHLFASGSLDKTIKIWKKQERAFSPRNPYKGLHAFTQEDAADFFGREKMIQELVETIQEILVSEQQGISPARILTVTGPSGSGKSSVVMAGLLPRLQSGVLFGSAEWVYLKPIVPGQDPVGSLALILSEHFPDRSSLSLRADLEDIRGLHGLAMQLVKRPGSKIVLLVDEFEELFTQAVSENERKLFIDLLLAAITAPSGPLLVLLTTDFSDQPMHYPDLSRLMELHRKSVLPIMDVHDLRAVIEQPVFLPDVQMFFEHELIDKLLFDIRGQSGALPLLEFTLYQLFQRRDGYNLTLQAYQQIGGVEGVAAEQAESIYNSLPSEEHRHFARVLFLRLITLNTTEQVAIRCRTVLSALLLPDARQTAVIHQVVLTFVAARLLTIHEVAGITSVEIGHEALLRAWSRLSDWLLNAGEDLRLQQIISADALEWVRRGKPKDWLYRGNKLAEAQIWARSNIPSRDEVAFLKAGLEQVRRSFWMRFARWLKGV